MSTTMSSERVTEAELARSRKARTIAKNWLEAEETRMKLAGLDPALEGDGTPGVQMRPSKFGRPSALERVKEARISGMEVAHFEKGLSGANEGAGQQKPPQTNPMALVQQKAEIIKALAPNHSPEQIAQYLEKVSPFLDTAMLAGSDPLAQSLLYSKIMSGGGQQTLSAKDVIELVATINQMKSQQPQSDPGQLANALATAMKSGVDAAKSNTDPLSIVTPILQQQTETVKAAYEGQLNLIKEQLRNKDPESELDRIAKYRDIFGWDQSEDPEIAKHRLSLADAQSERAFTLERERWAKEWDSRMEDRKARNQAETIKTIVGNVSKALESPVVKTLGRDLGSKLGVQNPIGQAQTKSAREILATPPNPMDEEFKHVCASCKSSFIFKRSDLVRLQATGGKWVCPSCSSVYLLSSDKDQDSKDEKRGTNVA